MVVNSGMVNIPIGDTPNDSRHVDTVRVASSNVIDSGNGECAIPHLSTEQVLMPSAITCSDNNDVVDVSNTNMAVHNQIIVVQEPAESAHGGSTNSGCLPSTQPDNPLIVVRGRKSVFVSRFAENTTEAMVKGYIGSKVSASDLEKFNIFKINASRPREISSFKIILPFSLFEKVVDRSFWPEGALVKEFVPRKKITAPISIEQPSSQVNAPKN